MSGVPGPDLMVVVPDPWIGLVLGLAAFRITRLLGWDTFPPAAWLRRKLTGAYVVTTGSFNARMGLTSETVGVEERHRRQWLSDLLWCPYCLGFWVAIAVYALWRWQPHWTLVVCAPLALSAFVGLTARNLDP